MRISDWSSDVCSSDLAHAQVGATRFHPVGRLAEGIDTVACDQVLLGNRGLLVEDVEQVEEELELADRQFPRVLGAEAEGVVRRPGFTAPRTRTDSGTLGRAWGGERVGEERTIPGAAV